MLPFCSESFVKPLAIEKRKFEAYTFIVLRVILCTAETSSVTLKEVHRLRVYQNRVLRRLRDEG